MLVCVAYVLIIIKVALRFIFFLLLQLLLETKRAGICEADERDSFRGLDVPRGCASSRPLGAAAAIEGEVGVAGGATNYHSH